MSFRRPTSELTGNAPTCTIRSCALFALSVPNLCGGRKVKSKRAYSFYVLLSDFNARNYWNAIMCCVGRCIDYRDCSLRNSHEALSICLHSSLDRVVCVRNPLSFHEGSVAFFSGYLAFSEL